MTVSTQHEPQPHSLWLVPDTTSLADLQTLVRDIAKSRDAPDFVPHVTLIGDLSGAPVSSLEACRNCLDFTGALAGQVTAVVRGPEFFMSLFLDLEIRPDIGAARQKLGTVLGVTASPFRPHISLAYGLEEGQIDADQIRRLEAAYIGTEILLDRIAVVSSAQSIPIAAWHALIEVSLNC